MFKALFKPALRNLWKNKVHSFLNIFGLAIGVACAGLIFLWVEDEVNYDQMHEKKDRVYKVLFNHTYDNGKIYTFFNASPGLFAPAIKAEIPGIANACRVSGWGESMLFKRDDKSIYEWGFYADPSLFSLFTIRFLQGNAQTAFREPGSVVISEKMAKHFFGDEKNIVGKVLTADNAHTFVVSGVVADMPPNSSIQFNWVAPFDIYWNKNPWLKEWGNYSLLTYVELSPNASVSAVNRQLYNFLLKKDPEAIAHPFLSGMHDWRLRDAYVNGQQSGGRIVYVRLFSVIAWIILLIACINFMNLSTARSEERAREVGVRKVLGSGRGALILQFIGEAMALSVLAVSISVVIIASALPAFNALVEKQLTLNIGNPVHILSLLGIALLCGLATGSYPALYLSSLRPVAVIKGFRFKTAGASFTRKGLVVFQFTISIVLIISTIVIYRQIRHVKDRDLGYDRNRLLEMPLQGDMKQHYAAIRQDLLNTGLIENVALTNVGPLYDGDNTGGFSWKGKDPNKQILISIRMVTPEYIPTAGMQLKAGRNFYPSAAADSFNVIITASMEKLMGAGSAIGKTITSQVVTSNEQRFTVVGVLKDYIYGNMYSKSDPVVFFHWPSEARQMFVRAKAGKRPEDVLAGMEAVMKRHNPAYPFTYRFVDDQFNELFKGEAVVGKLSRLFAILAILISCLGLFGLAAYTTARRTKEIGVRKVLGASITSVVTLLSKDFIKLVLIGLLIASPLAWYIMGRWLEDYAYRIDIQWWIFILAGLLAIGIALLTVSFQSIKAALSDPVKSLRTE